MPISLGDKIHSNACFLRGRFEDSDLELVDSVGGCSYTDRALDTTSRSVDCAERNHKHFHRIKKLCSRLRHPRLSIDQ